MQSTDEVSVVGMMADRLHLDLEAIRLQGDFGPRNGQLAEPAFAETAAHHDALSLVLGLRLEETRAT